MMNNNDKDAFEAIKNILLMKRDLWVEGHEVSMFYDADDDKYHVCKIDDDTFDIKEYTYSDKNIDEGIKKFIEWFNDDRISFTDGEVHA